MEFEEETITYYGLDGEITHTETVQVEIPEEQVKQRRAVQEYRQATLAILDSNANAVTKNFVRAQAKLMKAMIRELQDLQVD